MFVAHVHRDRALARVLIAVAGGAVALPFSVGILRATRRLARSLAASVVPRGDGDQVDLGKAPRAMIAVNLQLVGILVAGLPLVALTQPFLPGFTALAVLVVALAVLLVLFWRSARDLHGHVRAASQVILEALAAQSAADGRHAPDPHAAAALLPGLTDWERVEIPAGAHAIGHSLADLALRGTTGATVLAIWRAEGGLAVPDAHEPLRAGDILAVTGSAEARTAAAAMLREPAPAPAAS